MKRDRGRRATFLNDVVRVSPRAAEGDAFVILLGERRWRAAKLAGLETIPAIVADETLSEAGIVQAQLSENIHRDDLSPIEQADAVARLMKASGCTAADAAKQICKSTSTVSKLLSLLVLPADVQARVAAGEIGLRASNAMARDIQAIALSTSHRPRKQKLTAVLDRERSVSTSGVDSTMDAFTAAVETLLVRLKAAKRKNLELPTTLAMFRDQAGL